MTASHLKMTPSIRGASIALLLLLTSACGSLLNSDKQPIESYWLEPLEPRVSAPHNVSGPGVALKISVVPGLDTDRILTLGPDARLNHYAGARWADNLPELLESLVNRTLAGSGKFSPLRADRNPEPGDCLLQLEAHEFFTRLNEAGESRSVEIQLQGRFECHSATRAIRLESSVPIHQQRMRSIIASYQQGMDDVLRSLLDQLDD